MFPCQALFPSYLPTFCQFPNISLTAVPNVSGLCSKQEPCTLLHLYCEQTLPCFKDQMCISALFFLSIASHIWDLKIVYTHTRKPDNLRCTHNAKQSCFDQWTINITMFSPEAPSISFDRLSCFNRSFSRNSLSSETF